MPVYDLEATTQDGLGYTPSCPLHTGDDEDSRHAIGTVLTQGLLCGGLDKQADAVGSLGS